MTTSEKLIANIEAATSDHHNIGVEFFKDSVRVSYAGHFVGFSTPDGDRAVISSVEPRDLMTPEGLRHVAAKAVIEAAAEAAGVKLSDR